MPLLNRIALYASEDLMHARMPHNLDKYATEREVSTEFPNIRELIFASPVLTGVMIVVVVVVV